MKISYLINVNKDYGLININKIYSLSDVNKDYGLTDINNDYGLMDITNNYDLFVITCFIKFFFSYICSSRIRKPLIIWCVKLFNSLTAFVEVQLEVSVYSVFTSMN